MTSYPEEVVITDTALMSPTEGSSTPSDQNDDFFSSWDKPTIKRPSNPPSRTSTPSVGNRTASPFLNPNANGVPRSKSPLNTSEGETSKPAAPTVIRKAPATTGPKKTNVLGAKKTNKLGAKKVTGADDIDFDAAEKKAKEEADRIAKLGYDPDAEEEIAPQAVRSASISKDTKIASPTPVNPTRPSYGAAPSHERTKSEVERLGMGVGRLGFGQVGSKKTSGAAPQKMGFGSTGGTRGGSDGRHPHFAVCSIDD